MANDVVNFNSHAHVERDTDFAALNICKNYFNSHAHVERDCSTHGLLQHLPHFNSHAHVERDCVCISLACICRISTHTLTWSVTIYFFTN